MSNRNISIVHWFPELEKHKCGYCKQINSNCSYGLQAESLTVEDYQYLIDRGWRRSGRYCYKPVMNVTCCPLYTIRCEALQIKLSKSQKKNIKRVNRFISEAVTDKSNDESHTDTEDMILDSVQPTKTVIKIDIDKIDSDQINVAIRNSIRNDALKTFNEPDTFEPAKDAQMGSSVSSLTHKYGDKYKPGEGANPAKPPCKKAKLVRLERKQQKLAAKGLDLPQQNYSQNQEKSLEEFIEDVSTSPKHKLKVCLVETGGREKDWNEVRSQEYTIYRKYQMVIHDDPSTKCTERQFTNFLLESPLQIVLKRLDPMDPSYIESAKLFTKYQMLVHNEKPYECDTESFQDFLVSTPLQHTESLEGPPCGYGSFHQQYWLDDKLIAVGVIDILPKCVSSVYFFYDPDYRNLTLGTYGSLRELYFVRELHQSAPTIKYYYMGFYIHSCQKMRYKAKLSPSYLLCPETYIWFPIDYCITKLDKEKYCRFNEDANAVDKHACNSLNDLDQLRVLVNYSKLVPFKFIRQKVNDHDDYLRFGNLIGKRCVSRIIYVDRVLDDDF